MIKAELSVSNICWGDNEDASAYDALNRLGVRYIDAAPTKAFPRLLMDGIDEDEVTAWQRQLRDRDLSVVGFQSLTYGRQENFISDNVESRSALQKHLRGIIQLAGRVGVQTVVYGSAGTRTHASDVAQREVWDRATEFFVQLDEVATEEGIVMGIEPVSTTWTKGKDVFGRTGAEVVKFASFLRQAHGVQNIKFVPDTFAMHDAGEDVAAVMSAASQGQVLAPHMQIAEPGMRAHGPESPIDHSLFDWAYSAQLRELTQRFPSDVPIIALEAFKPGFDEDTAEVLERSVRTAQRNYAISLHS